VIRTFEAPISRRRAPTPLVAGLVGLSLLAPAQGALAGSGGEDVRLVLSVPSGMSMAGVAEDVRRAGGEVLEQLRFVRTLVVELPSGVALPDGVVAAADRGLSVSGTDPATGGAVSTVRETVGATSAAAGDGVTVAVVDTGVAEVGDLAGTVVGHVNVSGGADGDGYGHGTFMAGLVAGTGAASGGAYAGVAPSAKVLDVQVADADGTTSLSNVLAGIDAVAKLRAVDPTLRVLNLSLSSGSPLPPSIDPLALALDGLWRQGVVVVVSAGNDGPDRNTITSPGDDPLLLTVGSVDEHRTGGRADDTVADFSARGPGGRGTKPEIIAPGVSVVSVRAPGSRSDTEFPGARVAEDYFRGSGTSMSAAVSSGAVAALLSARPELTADQVKGLLVGTAYDAAGFGDRFAVGAGGLDLAAALTAKVSGYTHPGQGAAGSKFGPVEKDAQAWEVFARSWSQSDWEQAARSWSALSPQTQRWASNAWALDVVGHGAGLADAKEFSARGRSARGWSAAGWSARTWSNAMWDTPSS